MNQSGVISAHKIIITHSLNVVEEWFLGEENDSKSKIAGNSNQ